MLNQVQHDDIFSFYTILNVVKNLKQSLDCARDDTSFYSIPVISLMHLNLYH